MCSIKLSDIIKQNCSPCISSKTSIGMRVVENNGYSVEILYNGCPIAYHNDGGELDIYIENDDRQYHVELKSWKAQNYYIEDSKIILTGKYSLEQLISYLNVEVIYELINEHVVKKQIVLTQNNQPVLYYRLKNSLKPLGDIERFWSFEQEHCTGGSLKERYPAAGFRFVDGLTVGLLTDAGYRNQWTMNRRKRKVVPDFKYDAFETVKTMPDPNFLTVSNEEEIMHHKNHVSFTFGEVHDHINTKDGKPTVQCFNTMKLGEPAVKTLFIFAQPAHTLQDFRVASQVRLAEGLGFIGTETEKILYADVMMVIWVTSPRDLTPHVVPNLNYSPDMYNRDAFFTITALHDKQLNETIWNKWAGTQDERGCIGTIITRHIGSVENKGNEATLHFIIWAMLNKRRFGTNLPMDKINKAVDFCKNEFDPNNTGKILAHFSLSQMDIQDWLAPDYPDGIGLAVNQGLYAVTMRAAKELECDISEDYLELLEEEYRNYYNEEEGYLMQYREDPDVVAIYDLGPEFLSLWLFNKQILTDEMVVNTLNNYPVFGDLAPVQGRRDGTYYNEGNSPFAEGMLNPPGTYYNNGSWLREEYCAYAAGKLHGWKDAEKRMEARLQAEIYLNPTEPFSHEFLPTNLENPHVGWWHSTGVFAWNIFILVANEKLGLRKPDMDPLFKKV